jgi:hypothetical protein
MRETAKLGGIGKTYATGMAIAFYAVWTGRFGSPLLDLPPFVHTNERVRSTKPVPIAHEEPPTPSALHEV